MTSSDFCCVAMPLEYQQMLSSRDFYVVGAPSEAIVDMQCIFFSHKVFPGVLQVIVSNAMVHLDLSTPPVQVSSDKSSLKPTWHR